MKEQIKELRARVSLQQSKATTMKLGQKVYLI